MASFRDLVICFLISALFLKSCNGLRSLQALVEEQPLGMTYHKGALLSGDISVNLIYYGKFAPAQRAIIADFIASLNSKKQAAEVQPSVSAWYNSLQKYFHESKTRFPNLVLGTQVLDENYSLGKNLKDQDLQKLAAKGAEKNAINIVLTSADVLVDGFCMSRCATHGASPKNKLGGGRFAYIWVGNSATQCPGQCAWPFHQPMYGPQTSPLVSPNADVGVDGMVINLGSMIAGTVTNPFGNGFFQGPKEAPLEAASACTGVYAKNAYPGYAGDLLVDKSSGASYNANGVNGRKYLLPSLFDPKTSTCSTLV